MNVIKKTVNLKEITYYNNNSSYGKLKPYIYFNILLTQKLDDIGIYDEDSFIEYSGNTNNLNIIEFDKQTLKSRKYGVEDYYDTNQIILTGTTDTKLNQFRTYIKNVPYKSNFDVVTESGYTFNDDNLLNEKVFIDRITSFSGDTYNYVMKGIKTEIDSGFNVISATTGIFYSDISGNTNNFSYKTQGSNKTNSDLKSIVKQDYLMGIVSKPTVISDIVIDRGEEVVMEKYLKLSEVITLDDLTNLGNGYYNIIK